MESHLRSILKALSWRVVATVITFLTAWLFIGTIETAIKIGLLDTIIKLGSYYYHERFWLRLKIGRKDEPEYYI